MAFASRSSATAALRFSISSSASFRTPNCRLRPPPRGRRSLTGLRSSIGFWRSARRRPDLPLDLRGTAFQLKVWRFLLSLDVGEVVSYGEGRQRPSAPRSPCAPPPSACGANRVGVLVPCHRVLRGNGELGGYRWGAARKRALLDIERRDRASAGMKTAVGELDWDDLGAQLTEQGYAATRPLLTESDCAALCESYHAADVAYRSTIDMSRYNFGSGEYKYFAYPLPALVNSLRQAFYRQLAPIANAWEACLGKEPSWPASLDELTRRCHAAGQLRPTAALALLRQR